VVDRWIPLVTAAYGTWVARPARMSMLPRDCDGSRLGQRVRPVLGDQRLVGKSHLSAVPWSSHPPRNQPVYRALGCFPTGSRPALFLAVSASLVSKP
jgi:hypothetical protein